MSNSPTRRDFVKKTIIATGAGSLLNACGINKSTPIAPNKIVKNTFSNKLLKMKGVTDAKLFIKPLNKSTEKNTDVLKVGIVGVGGRGMGSLRNALEADSNIKIWAIGDIKSASEIQKKLTSLKKYGKRSKVPNNRIFSGFDAYEKVIASGADIIFLTTTPCFRPLHIKAAIDANKHIFAEKPLAVDAVGLHSVMESTKKAKEKNLSFLTGFVWRYTPRAQDTLSHLLKGDFGRITGVSSQYFSAGRPNGLSYNSKFQRKGKFNIYISKWQNYTELGGDSLIEQAIHGVDKINWAMNNSRDVSCVANGGQARPYPANTFDHFSITYNYRDGREAFMNSRQLPKTSGGVQEKFFTPEGYATLYGSFHDKNNKKIWQSKESGILGYQNEHSILYSHIRAGKVFNDSDTSITSTGIAIMGRMAAYTGKRVSWNDLMKSKEVLFDNTISYSHQMLYSVSNLPIPGITKFI